jgi:hypothetical protein
MTAMKSKAQCEFHGMQKFAITRKEEFDLVRELHYSNWKNGGALHLGGFKENGTWYVNNPKKEKLYSEAIPSQSNEECLDIHGTSGLPETRSTNCFSSSWYIFCQWDLVSKGHTCSTS